VILGVAILGPVVARPIARIIGAPLPFLRGLPARWPVRTRTRNPKRTSTTAAA
jgi:putative ABC transport system permease protein